MSNSRECGLIYVLCPRCRFKVERTKVMSPNEKVWEETCIEAKVQEIKDWHWCTHLMEAIRKPVRQNPVRR